MFAAKVSVLANVTAPPVVVTVAWPGRVSASEKVTASAPVPVFTVKSAVSDESAMDTSFADTKVKPEPGVMPPASVMCKSTPLTVNTSVSISPAPPWSPFTEMLPLESDAIEAGAIRFSSTSGCNVNFFPSGNAVTSRFLSDWRNFCQSVVDGGLIRIMAVKSLGVELGGLPDRRCPYTTR